jgi:hypothetical protein
MTRAHLYPSCSHIPPVHTFCETTAQVLGGVCVTPTRLNTHLLLALLSHSNSDSFLQMHTAGTAQPQQCHQRLPTQLARCPAARRRTALTRLPSSSVSIRRSGCGISLLITQWIVGAFATTPHPCRLHTVTHHPCRLHTVTPHPCRLHARRCTHTHTHTHCHVCPNVSPTLLCVKRCCARVFIRQHEHAATRNKCDDVQVCHRVP